MKIGILSRKAELYSTRRLVEAARDRNHEVRVINPLRCYMDITSHHPEIHYKGEKLQGFDAIIPRIGASITFYGTAVVRQFEMIGVFCLNESVAISRSRDKLRSLQLLARKGLGLAGDRVCALHPIYGRSDQPGGGAPLVVKMIEGTQGVGVVLAETDKAAQSVIQAFRSLKANILVQELSKSPAAGTFAAGSSAIKSWPPCCARGRRGSSARTCTGAGARKPFALPPRNDRRPCGPPRSWGCVWPGSTCCARTTDRSSWRSIHRRGLEGIEKTTGKDVAGMVIAYIEKNAAPGKTRTKGRG
jgi:ribosomal protein S6--L-glutamate ligase